MSEIKGLEFGFNLNEISIGFYINLYSEEKFPTVVSITFGPLFLTINRWQYWKGYLK